MLAVFVTAMVVVGAFAIFYLTVPQSAQRGVATSSVAQTVATTTISSIATSIASSIATTTSVLVTAVSTLPATATADWGKYLGYVPPEYNLVPRLPNSPVWPCAKGMSADQCQTFKSTCGNGVCDPNERCDTCALDCGATGAMRCDPYTGRPGAPASVCQIVAPQDD